jgi:N-acetylmuramoyl-L-alanine amidase
MGRKRSRRKRRLILTHLLAAAAGSAAAGLAFCGWQHYRTRPPTRPDPLRTPPQAYRWADLPEPAFPIPPFANRLAGVKIVLDPGHGGRGDRPNWKRGPTGLREEEVNLAVAHYLREFLEAVGAKVVMTRTDDTCLDPDEKIDLARRIEIANQLRADLFISIHHNAASEPGPNYTTIYYHGDPDASPASRCAARYLLTGLNDTLRLEQHVPCALLSDRLRYQNGFYVLREARVPAVLVEASFHSNPQEERRLRDPLYNRREAYGYFLGLARWAQAGLPRIRLLEPSEDAVGPGKTVVIGLDDGLGGNSAGIVASSLVVRVNGEPTRFSLDSHRSRVQLVLPSRLKGSTVPVYVDFQNVFGQHVLHPQLELSLADAR